MMDTVAFSVSQTLAKALFLSAQIYGGVDCRDVEQILLVSEAEATAYQPPGPFPLQSPGLTVPEYQGDAGTQASTGTGAAQSPAVPVPQGPRLTDQMRLDIARRFVSQMSVHRLAIALKVDDYSASAYLNSCRQITEASKQVIDEWMREQSSEQQAFVKMKEALTAMKEYRIVAEVMGGNGN